MQQPAVIGKFCYQLGSVIVGVEEWYVIACSDFCQEMDSL